MLKGLFKFGILIMGMTVLAVSPLSAADQTDVIITRTNSSVEKGRPVTVYIDDVRVGTLMPGRRLNIRVNNGTHTVYAVLTQSRTLTNISRDDISSEFQYFTADDSKTLTIRVDVISRPGLIPLTTVPVVVLNVE